MGTGIICILAAAFMNSVGYLASARFMKRYNSPVRLLIVAQVCMMALSIPFLPFVFPFGHVNDMRNYLLVAAGWEAVFIIGQCSFFIAQKYFESSRLSSLLGLKIIVLTVIFITMKSGHVNGGQWLAVVMAAVAAMAFNWSGSGKTDHRGWLFLFITLICYSLADIIETKLITVVRESGFGLIRSAFATTFFLYSLLGLLSTPFLFYSRPDWPQVKTAFPYSAIWLCSQIVLLAGYALVKPVFGNVILATRGIFSVLIGAALPLFGLAALDSQIPMRKWIQRGIAAVIMLAAIAVYSFSTN